jgi:hypothetical protein
VYIKFYILQEKSDKDNDKKDDLFLFGTAAEFKPDLVPKKIPTFDDPMSLADPSVSCLS